MKNANAKEIESFVIKDQEFTALDEVKTDSKNRVSLGRKLRLRARFYKVFENSWGQIVLDPLATVSAHEAWLFKNPAALDSVKRGMDDLKNGSVHKAKESFSKFAEE